MDAAGDASTLDRLEFMLGRWVAVLAEDAVEEVWTRPSADSMMGMFCWSRATGPDLYEFLVIEDRPTGATLSLRTFPTGASEHEASNRPLAWRLLRLDDDEVVFGAANASASFRITYRHVREDRMYASLERRQGQQVQLAPYQYRRIGLAPRTDRSAAPPA